MWRSNFRYYAELESPGGEPLSDVPLEVDWVPALRWAEFEQTMRHDNRSDARAHQPLIEPLWSPEGQPPFVRGVSISCVEHDTAPVEFPLTYLFDAVTAASAELVESGVLENGQQFDYKVYALACDQVNAADGPATITALEERPAIEDARLEPRVQRGEAGGGAVPVVVADEVLSEATALAAAAADLETGGILVGKLCRDPDGTLFAHVTAQIPAEHTDRKHMSLRLTPETWVGVDAALRLRNRGEITLGWWHSHPFFCRRCPPVRRALCPFSEPVFSSADRHVHREVFQQPWSIALLLSFLGEPTPSYDVFGWNEGRIEAIGFVTPSGHTGNTEDQS